MLYKVVLNSATVDEMLKFDNFYKSYCPLLSCCAVDYDTVDESNFPSQLIKSTSTGFRTNVFCPIRQYAERNERVIGDDGKFTHSLTSDVMLCYECVS